jgi:hypothetical protein
VDEITFLKQISPAAIAQEFIQNLICTGQETLTGIEKIEAPYAKLQQDEGEGSQNNSTDVAQCSTRFQKELQKGLANVKTLLEIEWKKILERKESFRSETKGPSAETSQEIIPVAVAKKLTAPCLVETSRNPPPALESSAGRLPHPPKTKPKKIAESDSQDPVQKKRKKNRPGQNARREYESQPNTMISIDQFVLFLVP